MLFLILLQLSFNKLISGIAHCCSFLSLQSIKDFFSREYANMIHPAGLAAYAAGLLCVFIWAYRKVSQTYRALQDECPWSLEKKTRELDFRARDAYHALAAQQGDKTELFHLLVQRAISAVKQYSGIKDEMLHFEQIKHLLTPSIVNRELYNLHLIVDELQNINLDGDKLTPGWGMWAILIMARNTVHRSDLYYGLLPCSGDPLHRTRSALSRCILQRTMLHFYAGAEAYKQANAHMQQQIQQIEQQKAQRAKHLEYLRRSGELWLDEQRKRRAAANDSIETGEETTTVCPWYWYSASIQCLC
jgi:hypothetical protein